MVIQECYYFIGVGVHYFVSSFSIELFRCQIYFFIFSVLTIDFCYSQLIFFCILLKKTKKLSK